MIVRENSTANLPMVGRAKPSTIHEVARDPVQWYLLHCCAQPCRLCARHLAAWLLHWIRGACKLIDGAVAHRAFVCALAPITYIIYRRMWRAGPGTEMPRLDTKAATEGLDVYNWTLTTQEWYAENFPTPVSTVDLP